MLDAWRSLAFREVPEFEHDDSFSASASAIALLLPEPATSGTLQHMSMIQVNYSQSLAIVFDPHRCPRSPGMYGNILDPQLREPSSVPAAR